LLFRVLADVVVVTHYAFLALVAFGGYLAWRWRWVLPVHLAAVAWGVIVVVAHLPCPLTALQNNFRERGGQQPLHASFIDTYVRGTVYPSGGAVLAWLVVAAIVAGSWVGLVRRHPAISAPHLTPRG
jgi:Protein of Unknown function (DUF2784)